MVWIDRLRVYGSLLVTMKQLALEALQECKFFRDMHVLEQVKSANIELKMNDHISIHTCNTRHNSFVQLTRFFYNFIDICG